ncbi:MAG: hypothetical protein WBG18_12880 [Xanthobacteraceae bacterium]
MAVVILCITLFVPNHSFARDDGRFANSPLKEWFDRLASKKRIVLRFCRFSTHCHVERCRHSQAVT